MKKNSLLLMLFAVALLISAAEGAPLWTDTEVVSTESTEDSEDVCLVVDSSGNVHVAWEDETNYDGCGLDRDIFYKRYEVATGWTTTEVVSTVSTAYSGAPFLVVDPNDTVHIAWNDDTDYDGCGSDSDIFYRSYNVQLGWTATQVVSTESTEPSFRPRLACDPNGNIHIAWSDATDYDGSGPDWDMFYKRYEPGTGWTVTEVVSTESTESAGTAYSTGSCLAVDSSGNVHIVWHDKTDYGSGAFRCIAYKRYEPGTGWTTTEEAVSTEEGDLRAQTYGPSLAIDSKDNVHITWFDRMLHEDLGFSHWEIFYKRYEPGTGWTAREWVSSETADCSWDCGLAVDSRDNVHIVWRDCAYRHWPYFDVCYKRYEAAAGWTTTEVVSTETTEKVGPPCVAVDPNDIIHIAWRDSTDRTGAGTDRDIFYKRSQPNDVTIKAYCYTEGQYVSVAITMDGSPTGHETPHTFTGLTGSHTFTVPHTDPNGHVFQQWCTGQTSQTITVTTGGTYTARYQLGINDVAITDVTPSETVVCQGGSVSISVDVENQGDFSETFDVIAYYDNIPIDTKTVINLPSGQGTTVNFNWDTTTTPAGSHTLKAHAHPVVGETDTSDNTYIDGTVLVQTYDLTITPTSGGATDPAVGTYTYGCGSVVEVNAIPEACYVFDHWKVDVNDINSANPISLVMDSNHTLEAVFVQIEYDLTITATSGGTTAPPPGTHTYACASVVEVNAIPDECYEFDHWELDGNSVDSNNPYLVVMDSNHMLYAVFFRAKACFPSPADGAEDVPTDVVLSWSPSVDANRHDVYFGTDYNDVNDVNISDLTGIYRGRQDVNSYDTNDYDANGLELGETYFWRIDEVNDPNVWKGNVWSFTTNDGTAWNPIPPDGAKDVATNAVLSWTPGERVADVNGHDVYFGTDYNDVSDANSSWPVASGPNDPNVYKGRQDANSYDPCGLELGETYYWRVDEVNDANVWKGAIWRFMVNHIVLDDFEDYNDSNPIWDTWLDGWWNDTGSWLELGIDPCDPVHASEQSMIYDYNNSYDQGVGYYSETEAATADLGVGSDWSGLGAKALTLYFYGDPNNDANDTEQMYVGLEDSLSNYGEVRYGDYGEDMNDIKSTTWQEWKISLQDFNDAGVDVNDVNKVYIGFGDRANQTVPGGVGVVYFDDIRLYARCGPAGDINVDCVVDFEDLEIICDEWLVQGGQLDADLYKDEDNRVNFKDFAVLANSWLEGQP